MAIVTILVNTAAITNCLDFENGGLPMALLVVKIKHLRVETWSVLKEEKKSRASHAFHPKFPSPP